MSEYVDIRTSVTDILAAANNLVTLGGSLESDMSPLIEAIKSRENAATWGNDEFTGKFLEGYHKSVKVGDGAMTAADAVKALGQGKNSLGTTTQDLGNIVVNAMLNYSDTDGANASGINSAGQV
jgi:hypothetical protein